MGDLHNLKFQLLTELEGYADRRDLSVSDLDTLHKLSGTVKNLCRIEEDGYSEDGYSRDGESYARGNYITRGRHWVRGHYSRDDGGDGGDGGGYSSRRYRYSRDDGRSQMMEHLEAAMDTATDRDRETIRRFMRQIEQS